MSDEFLTREEAARLLRLKSPRTLLDWEREGRGPKPIKASPRVTLYGRSDVLAYLDACRASPSRSASEANILAERRRCYAITKRAPKGFETAALQAIKNGTSLEAFDASLPGELRAVMPQLHQFLSELDKPVDYADEAAGRAILDSYAKGGM